MRHSILIALSGLILLPISSVTLATPDYQSVIDSDQRSKCFYGYVARKTGDHASAIRIFEDCIARWQDGYSYIGLAQIYETGVGVQKDLAYANTLLRTAAELEGGYASLAKYNYALNLFEGKGVEANSNLAWQWMRLSAEEGFTPALEYLKLKDAP